MSRVRVATDKTGADDVAADAVLLALAMPGRPVRVQWMREQEHAWEPFGPGMVAKILGYRRSADGSVVDWSHEVWSQSHMDAAWLPPGTLLPRANIWRTRFRLAPPVALAQAGRRRRPQCDPPLRVPERSGRCNHFLPEHAAPRLVS